MKRVNCLILIPILMSLTAFNVHAQLNSVTGVSVSEEGSVTTVAIQGQTELKFRHFVLEGTEPGIIQKIVIDIEGARYNIAGKMQEYSRGPVARVRSSQFLENPPMVRVVTDLRVPATVRVEKSDTNVLLTLSNYLYEEPAPIVVVEPITVGEEPLKEEDKQLIRLNLKGATLGHALELFQRVYGMNILVAKSVAKDDLIDVFLTDEFNKESLFESILIANGYKFVKKQNLYIVLGQEITIDDEIQMEIFKLEYINAVDILENLEAIISEVGAVQVVSRSPMGNSDITVPSGGGGGGAAGGAAGGGGGSPLEGVETIVGEAVGDGRSDMLIVVDRPGNLERIRTIIRTLDVPVPQVHITVKVVETQLGEDENWGLNWQSIFEVVGAGGKATGVSAAGGGAGGAGGTEVEGLGMKIGNFKAGTLSLAQFKVALSLLEQRKDSKLLNQPSITTMDNQQATIALGTTIPIEVTQIGGAAGAAGGGAAGGGAGGGAAGGAITTVQQQNIVVALSVIPKVNEDKYITLWVKPVIQEVTGFTGKNADQPIISSRTATTQVRVRSGEVVLIGGLIKEDNIKTVTKVKFFGSLPLLGKFFTHNRVDKKRSELVIFIAPEIVHIDPTVDNVVNNTLQR